MGNFRAKRTSLIEVAVTQGVQSFTFGLQNLLSGKRLKYLLYFSESAKTPTGKDNLQGNNGIYIRLRDTNNVNVHDYLPAQMLNSNDSSLLELEDINISWEKSEVFIQDPSSIPANSAVLFLAVFE